MANPTERSRLMPPRCLWQLFSVRIILYFSLMSGVLIPAFSYEWPVENHAVTATFGENRWGHFHGGIDIGGGEQEIRPIEDGEIIFHYEESDDPNGIPTGLGNFVVVEHERGIRSLYAHLKPEPAFLQKVSVSKEDVIGIIGETGGALGKHLHLEVFDGELNRLVNPLELLPDLADGSVPDIDGLYIERDGNTVRLEPRLRVMQGQWDFIIDTYDTSIVNGRIYPVAPYRVFVYVNGREEIALSFESLEEYGNDLVLSKSGRITDEQLYIDDWRLRLGKLQLQEGEVQLEVVVSDISGNEVAETMWISVAGK